MIWFENIKFLFSGCLDSNKSVTFYRETVENDTKMVKNIRKLVQVITILCYVPQCFVPISYLIFGSPKKEEWQLPFPVKNLI